MIFLKKYGKINHFLNSKILKKEKVEVIIWITMGIFMIFMKQNMIKKLKNLLDGQLNTKMENKKILNILHNID